MPLAQHHQKMKMSRAPPAIFKIAPHAASQHHQMVKMCRAPPAIFKIDPHADLRGTIRR